jgi:electron transport complex protein RnfA
MVLARLLGLQPCADAPTDRRRTLALALALTAVVTAGSLAAWALRVLVLEPRGLPWLLSPLTALAVVAVASLLRAGLRAAGAPAVRSLTPAVQPLGVLAAALGVALAVSRERFGALETLTAGAASGLGFLVAQSILAAVAARMETEPAPRFLRGLPLALLSAGLAALAFAGLDRALVARLVGQ